MSVQVDEPGDHLPSVGSRSPRRNAVSSRPSAPGAPNRAGSSTIGAPCSMTAPIAVCHPTPNSAATAATLSPSSPTRRQISARARSVSDARDGSPRWSRSTCPSRSPHRGNTRSASPTRAARADPRSGDPEPALDGDRAQPHAHHRPDNRPDPRSSPPPTTVRSHSRPRGLSTPAAAGRPPAGHNAGRAPRVQPAEDGGLAAIPSRSRRWRLTPWHGISRSTGPEPAAWCSRTRMASRSGGRRSHTSGDRRPRPSVASRGVVEVGR